MRYHSTTAVIQENSQRWPYHTLRKKCLYSELFWSAFSRIQTEYGETLHISPYSVRMRENVDQSNSEYGLFLRSDDAIRF